MNLKEDVYRFAIEKPLDELIRKMSAFNDHNTDLEDAYHGDIIRCYAYIGNGKFGLRTNTIQMYHLANTKVKLITIYFIYINNFILNISLIIKINIIDIRMVE